MTTYTPGPWRVRSNLVGPLEIVRDLPRGHALEPIALVGADTFPQCQANAELIAAAPDLYAALRDLLDRSGHMSPLNGEASVAAVRRAGKYMEAVDAARAAIAKAEGGSA